MYKILLLGLLTFLISCSDKNDSLVKSNLEYLGQTPPGLNPKIFAPGIISSANYERSLVFSPKGDELFFQKRGFNYKTYIVYMEQKSGKWTDPSMASFSGLTKNGDDAPFFSYDGKDLFFDSKRPIPGTNIHTKKSNIWKIAKTEKGWSNLEYIPELNSDFYDDYPTISKDRTIYFSSNRDGNYDIYFSRFINGKYLKPKNVGVPICTENYEGHPFIAADKSYLIFSSDRPDQLGDADLYISFKNGKGEWSEPINMGDKINTPKHEAAPYVSPDGKYLFFCSFRYNETNLNTDKKYNYDELTEKLNSPGNGSGDIYWVSAEIINELKKNKINFYSGE